MSTTNKPGMSVDVYEQFPRERGNAACHQFTLEQVKQYLSSKPLRRGPQHKAAIEADAPTNANNPGESDRT